MTSIYQNVSPCRVPFRSDIGIHEYPGEIPEGMMWSDIASLPYINLKQDARSEGTGRFSVDDLPMAAHEFLEWLHKPVYLAVCFDEDHWDISEEVEYCGNTTRYIYIRSYATGRYKRFDKMRTFVLGNKEMTE